MKTRFIVDSVLRMQLNEDGTTVRWEYNYELGEWVDGGPGIWVDAIVIANTFNPKGYIFPKDELSVVLSLVNLDGDDIQYIVPLENNLIYPKPGLLGYPYPSKDNFIPQCECGSDNTYGSTNLLHTDWCEKGQMLVIPELG